MNTAAGWTITFGWACGKASTFAKARAPGINHTGIATYREGISACGIVLSRPDDNHPPSAVRLVFGRCGHVRDARSGELSAALPSRPGRRACAGVRPDRAGVRTGLCPTSAADLGDRGGADRPARNPAALGAGTPRQIRGFRRRCADGLCRLRLRRHPGLGDAAAALEPAGVLSFGRSSRGCMVRARLLTMGGPHPEERRVSK